MPRKTRREYEGDVFYEVWRAGGNPDAINFDRVEDRRWDEWEPEETAADELRRHRRAADDGEPDTDEGGE
jgi:hypothetical protein